MENRISCRFSSRFHVAGRHLRPSQAVRRRMARGAWRRYGVRSPRAPKQEFMYIFAVLYIKCVAPGLRLPSALLQGDGCGGGLQAMRGAALIVYCNDRTC